MLESIPQYACEIEAFGLCVNSIWTSVLIFYEHKWGARMWFKMVKFSRTTNPSNKVVVGETAAIATIAP